MAFAREMDQVIRLKGVKRRRNRAPAREAVVRRAVDDGE
jgi:hypothetical protein